MAYYNFGNTLYTKGLFDEAINVYKKTIKLKQDFAEAYYNLGITFNNMGRFDLAIETFQNFIKYAPPQDAQQVEQIRKLILELKGQV